MFATHQRIISNAAHADLQIFKDAGTLCILSARMPFSRVADDLAGIKGGNTAPLFAWKSDAYHQHNREAETRRNLLQGLNARRTLYLGMGWVGQAIKTETAMLSYVLTWYGFNLIKGGFFLQMCHGVAGCIDTRNERDYGVAAADIRAVPDTASRHTRDRRARAYLKLVRSLGGTERLWDAWCAYYAESGDNPDWQTGWDVSAEHCRILGLPDGEPETEIPF